MVKKLPDEQVNLKISTCGKCNGVVRVAVIYMMDRKTKNEFAKEVMDYNLSVKEQSLVEYRKTKTNFCECQ